MTSPSDTNPFSPSDISIPSGGSRILSESYTDTGPGGADLSLSELSIASPSIHYKPFNIITAVNPRAQAHRDIIEDEDSFQPDRTVLSNDTTEAEHEGDQTPTAEETHAVNSSEKTREEKLQNDLFVLKKINASLGAYHEALLSTRSSTDVCGFVILLSTAFNFLAAGSRATRTDGSITKQIHGYFNQV